MTRESVEFVQRHLSATGAVGNDDGDVGEGRKRMRGKTTETLTRINQPIKM